MGLLPNLKDEKVDDNLKNDNNNPNNSNDNDNNNDDQTKKEKKINIAQKLSFRVLPDQGSNWKLTGRSSYEQEFLSDDHFALNIEFFNYSDIPIHKIILNLFTDPNILKIEKTMGVSRCDQDHDQIIYDFKSNPFKAGFRSSKIIFSCKKPGKTSISFNALLPEFSEAPISIDESFYVSVLDEKETIKPNIYINPTTAKILPQYSDLIIISINIANFSSSKTFSNVKIENIIPENSFGAIAISNITNGSLINNKDLSLPPIPPKGQPINSVIILKPLSEAYLQFYPQISGFLNGKQISIPYQQLSLMISKPELPPLTQVSLKNIGIELKNTAISLRKTPSTENLSIRDIFILHDDIINPNKKIILDSSFSIHNNMLSLTVFIINNYPKPVSLSSLELPYFSDPISIEPSLDFKSSDSNLIITLNDKKLNSSEIFQVNLSFNLSSLPLQKYKSVPLQPILLYFIDEPDNLFYKFAPTKTIRRTHDHE